ncbi:MAG: DUF6899 family protein [Thermoanaerobaculia bacterium]
MPYIGRKRREALSVEPPQTVGELTYEITVLVEDYRATRGTSFQTYAEIIGALEAAKLELYRRRVAVYEDAKLLENGEVYR